MGQFLAYIGRRCPWSPTSPNAEEVVPLIKVGLNPHLGLAQGHNGRNM
jgi:hypothetical protein